MDHLNINAIATKTAKVEVISDKKLREAIISTIQYKGLKIEGSHRKAIGDLAFDICNNQKP